MKKQVYANFRFVERLFKAVFWTIIFSVTVAAAPSDLDPAFGIGGKVNTTIPVNGLSFISMSSMALQADGKIVVAGTGRISSATQPDFFVARYNSNGTPDTTFGSGGQVFTDFTGRSDEAYSVAVQADGKIVVVGRSETSAANDNDFAIVRYNSDGSLDTSFDGDGKIVIAFAGVYERANEVKILADGKILVAGDTLNGASFNGSLVLMKFNSDGSPDANFGSAGRITHDLDGQRETVTDMAIQPDGRIVLCGGIVISGTSDVGYIARFETNGSLLSFYRRTFSENPSVFSAVAVREDGRIVGVGSLNNSFMGVELSSSGFLNGSLAVPSPSSGYYSSAAIQANGKIVAVGKRNSQFTTVKYNTYDSFDSSFGVGGIVDTAVVSGSSENAQDVLIQPDGKILVGGNSGNNKSVSLIRYLGDFVAPSKTAFDYDGDRKADISVYRPSNRYWYLSGSSAGFSAVPVTFNDRITPADYDGDGKTDVSVYTSGYWNTINSSTNTFSAIYFGLATDVPVPADYDGDGKADQAVYRDGTWHLRRSTAGFASISFGAAADKPIPADYDGDGKADIAVFRSGIWYYLQSSNNNFAAVSFGTATDKPVPADYDGDGKTDIAVYRSGIWYLNRSIGGFAAVSFGAAADVPIPADFDGDGKTDQAVFRDGTWYLLQSANGFASQIFGFSSDKPTPAAFVP